MLQLCCIGKNQSEAYMGFTWPDTRLTPDFADRFRGLTMGSKSDCSAPQKTCINNQIISVSYAPSEALSTAQREAVMLTHLAIRNFTLVDHLELDLKPGMTVITGETGAGKSIVLDALGQT